MLKKRMLIATLLVVILILGLLCSALKEARHLHRDPTVLMNTYYQFKDYNPQVAKNALLILLHQNANDVVALQEYSQWILNKPHPVDALQELQRLHQLRPDNALYTFQLGYLYYVKGEWAHAKQVFSDSLVQATGQFRQTLLDALQAMASYLPYYQFHAQVAWFSPPLVVKPKVRSLFQGLQGQSLQIQTFKQAGYLAIVKGDNARALEVFHHAYALTYQPDLAMQLAYLYDGVNNKPAAYHYFQIATHSQDQKVRDQAQLALTHLSGQQTKALPAPYFSEFYFNPFTQSRFGLTVVPMLWRLGIEQNHCFKSKTYVYMRRTQDNRTQNLGEISQIYEDNVQIMGAGGQFSPLRAIPVIGFVEAGEAYDLVYQNRPRWRGDLRAGAMYYQEWGVRPGYYDTLKVSHNYYSDLYGDLTYFSRYNNNVVALLRTHQGIHLLQYQSSLVNLYVTGRVIADTNREFFNNIAEVGPGIAYIPSNRWNVQIRFEHVNGVYLPAGGSVNPYKKYYSNQIVQVLVYVNV